MTHMNDRTWDLLWNYNNYNTWWFDDFFWIPKRFALRANFRKMSLTGRSRKGAMLMDMTHDLMINYDGLLHVR